MVKTIFPAVLLNSYSMKNTLSVRLYGGLILAVLLVLVVGFMSVYSVEQQAKESSLVDHSQRVLMKLRDIRYNLLQMRGARRAFAITGNPSYMTMYTKGDAAIPPALVALKELLADNPTQMMHAQSIEDSIHNVFTYWNADGKVTAGITQAQLQQIVTEEESRLNAVYSLFEKVKSNEDRLLVIRKARTEQSVTQSKTVLITGVSLLMMVVLLLINTVIQAFKSRYRAGLRLQASIDELAKVNSLTEEKNWLLTGLSEINTQMQDVKSTSELANRIITAIIHYNQLPAGALYLYDDDIKKLKLTAGYALPGTKKMTLSIGEGMVGAAAQQKDVLVVKDVPKEYWHLQTASGFGAPGELAYMPLWLNGELKGVVELVSFGSFSEQEKRFLQMISNHLSVAIHSRLAADSVTKLLTQVQFQKEFLEQQQHNLKRANEELQKQAQILQSSEEELKVQEEELRQINAELEERNEAVEIARQTLSQKARELEAASRYKSEFLANMSHELRTPLNSVLILAKLLSENKAKNLNDKQIEYANIIHKSGSDLLNLINDILDLSKIEAGKVEIHAEKVLLQHITINMRSMFDVVSQEKQVSFTVNVASGISEQIITDQQRVEQIIKNLLSNAFKFTPKGGAVSLNIFSPSNFIPTAATLKEAKQIIAFEVKDTGIGIPADKQQLIFEAFQQADGSTSRKYGGTGLGLSISRELIRMLGGELRLESKDGEGSIFTLYLPVNVSEVLPNIGVHNNDTSVAEAFVLDPSVIPLQTVIKDDRSIVKPGDKVMLIIEDDFSFASILNEFARNKGYKTIVALQGDEGLYYAKSYKPSAIILDMQLPVLDGWNIIRLLKQEDTTKHIPVHIISAADEAKLAAGGALAYLKKPVQKADLEMAFNLIRRKLQGNIKKVLVIAGESLTGESLKGLFDSRHVEAVCTYAKSVKVAIELAKDELFDCIIADIGNDIEKGIKSLQELQQHPDTKSVPVIIYLDGDISSTDELQLKKISNVIIRESSQSKDRLMDELELFLHKVQEVDQTNLKFANSAAPVLDDFQTLAKRRILVVDDDMRNVFVLTTLLEEHQMQVYTANDGKEAIDMLLQHSDIELVLMDIMMPEMDGYEAMRRIRAMQQFNNLPMIALTAKAMTGDREKCIEAGASDYITKPVDNNKLLSLMRVWLSQ